jgi:hypothetical protein
MGKSEKGSGSVIVVEGKDGWDPLVETSLYCLPSIQNYENAENRLIDCFGWILCQGSLECQRKKKG